MSTCDYCSETGPTEEVCYQGGPHGYVCTRKPGHIGPCIACGTGHQEAKWADS